MPLQIKCHKSMLVDTRRLTEPFHVSLAKAEVRYDVDILIHELVIKSLNDTEKRPER